MEPKKKPIGIRQVGAKFEARLAFGTKRKSLGQFATMEEALAAYASAKEAARSRYPSKRRDVITQARLKALFTYDPESGLFTRLSHAGGQPAGLIAGSSNYQGYRHLKVDGRRYLEHQMAWLYMTGSLVLGLDHIDGNRANNRFANLRLASHAENQQNRAAKSNNSSGLMGVNWHAASGKFQARIMIDHKSHHLGYFSNPADAHQAYLAAKKQLHRFQPVPRDL